MTILASFAFLIYLQPGPATVALRDGCTADDVELAAVGAADTVEVQSAIAGGEGVCYKIALRREGRTLSGYVLGEALPAITAYVQAREAASAIRLEAVAHQPAASPAIANAAPAEPSATTAYPEFFENFTARDTTGKTVSLAAMPGRVILVTFWSSRGAASKRNLTGLLPLYNQYKKRGLSAIGINMDSGSKHLAEALDDTTLGWPQVADPSGLAKRYGVDPGVGKSFVLDQSRRIIAAGSGPELERKVRELLAKP